MKTWLVVKIWYGDFSVRQETIVAAGEEILVKTEVEKLNLKLTGKEKKECIHYEARCVRTLR